jgi:hypothetical protein
MRVFMLVLLCVALVLPILAYAEKDYNYFDKRGNYQGFARDNDRETSFYNNHGRPTGTYYKDSGVMMDGHNRFQGFVIDNDNDD